MAQTLESVVLHQLSLQEVVVVEARSNLQSSPICHRMLQLQVDFYKTCIGHWKTPT